MRWLQIWRTRCWGIGILDLISTSLLQIATQTPWRNTYISRFSTESACPWTLGAIIIYKTRELSNFPIWHHHPGRRQVVHTALRLSPDLGFLQRTPTAKGRGGSGWTQPEHCTEFAFQTQHLPPATQQANPRRDGADWGHPSVVSCLGVAGSRRRKHPHMSGIERERTSKDGLGFPYPTARGCAADARAPGGRG